MAINETVAESPLCLVITNDKRLAKQLADHHIALAQAYLKLAGEPPLMTGAQRRKIEYRLNCKQDSI